MSSSSHIPSEYTIEIVHGKVWHCEHGVYSSSSVLEGNDYRQLMECYDTVAEAVAAHPTARVIEGEWEPAPVAMSRVAPDWFDPDDAGERWDDDY
jgi:hypothetical protein